MKYVASIVGTWLSLVEHRVRDAGAAGSNPVVPTTPPSMVFERSTFWFIRFFVVGQDAKNVQKTDHKLLPLPLKSNIRGVAASSDGRQCIRNRPLFCCRPHNCSYTSQGFSPDCIPWFPSPS